MRKQTLKCLIDDIFWYALYMLPLFIMLVMTFKTGVFVSLSSSLNSAGLGLLTENPVLTAISSIFGVGGILPFFSSPDLLIYVSYFICTFVLHILVDFVLFIPRLCHKWCQSLYGGEK